MTKRLDYNQIAPNGAEAPDGVNGYVMQNSPPSELVDLVDFRVSQINTCAYCLDMPTRDLIMMEVKVEKLALVQAWEECGSLFRAAERAALALGESVTPVSETGVPDRVYR